MSADSWDTCPRCLIKAEREKAAEVVAMNNAYGKVPVEEYLALRAVAEAPIDLEETLREDYELGIASRESMSMPPGVFYVSYSAKCQTDGCGFEFKYDNESTTAVDE